MGYATSQAITIDHTKCGTADVTSFPLLINSTIAGLKTVANGGSLQTGNDFAFFSDATLTTALDFELESLNTTTGAIIAWVRIPTLTFASDKVIYLAYGDATVSTSQATNTAVWDSNFKAVYHFGTGGGSYTTAERKDSTANANTLANGSSSAPTTTGIVGDAMDASGYVSSLGVVDTASIRLTSAFTVEGWCKPTNFSDWRTLVGKGHNTQRNYELRCDQTTGRPTVTFTQGVSTFKAVTGTGAISTSVFSYLVGSWDGTTLKLYVNGSSVGTPLAVSGSADNVTDDMVIGAITVGGTNDPFVGPLDEIRLSNTARSTSYITATYNNINSPSTFYTIGAGGTPPAPTSSTQRFTLSML